MTLEARACACVEDVVCGVCMTGGATALTLDLRHYCADEMSLDRSRRYTQGRVGLPFGKPDGLWVSVKGPDDWPTWCAQEGWALDRQVPHRVVLRPSARVLHIDSMSDLVAFTDTYGGPIPGWFSQRIEIDWIRVAQAFGGVIIAPYQWPARMSLSWYYGWDVASGCIWDLDAIESVDPIEVGS